MKSVKVTLESVDPMLTATPLVVAHPLLVSLELAGKILGVGRSTIYALIDDGDLRPVKVRGRTLMLYADLEAYVTRLVEDTARE